MSWHLLQFFSSEMVFRFIYVIRSYSTLQARRLRRLLWLPLRPHLLGCSSLHDLHPNPTAPYQHPLNLPAGVSPLEGSNQPLDVRRKKVVQKDFSASLGLSSRGWINGWMSLSVLSVEMRCQTTGFYFQWIFFWRCTNLSGKKKSFNSKSTISALYLT